MVQGPAETLCNLTEMQILKPHSKPSGLESLKLEPKSPYLGSPGDLYTAKLLEAWSTEDSVEVIILLSKEDS